MQCQWKHIQTKAMWLVFLAEGCPPFVLPIVTAGILISFLKTMVKYGAAPYCKKSPSAFSHPNFPRGGVAAMAWHIAKDLSPLGSRAAAGCSAAWLFLFFRPLIAKPEEDDRTCGCRDRRRKKKKIDVDHESLLLSG